MSSSPITVLLADDHTIVRQGLKVLLDAEPDIKVIGEANDGREAVELAASLRPDLILMDISMPKLNGIEAASRILEANPAARILMLSAHADDATIQRVIAARLSGFLLKDTPRDVLAHAVREVHSGRNFLSPVIASRLQERAAGPSHNGTPVKQVPQLTSREREVLQLIAEGRANKQTADELGISIKTVEKHRQHLMEKLGIHDTASLTRYAISIGVVESGGQDM